MLGYWRRCAEGVGGGYASACKGVARGEGLVHTPGFKVGRSIVSEIKGIRRGNKSSSNKWYECRDR